MKINEFTVFQSLEASGDTLRYGYRVDETLATVNTSSKGAIVAEICAPEFLGDLIARGGKVIETYRTMDGRIMAEFVITAMDCTT
ncbi:hypothetical protein DS901_02365 [Loktanella sp. D2R18]|uniref:hypothetical protein n=1 Tax=Rhodobacterales TaxID=204455 RepID=UPI000DEA46DF|nr:MULTISPECIES: hypothetical protein [Rhodobacterales]MDO6589863.1 hypothetical protein [Yoonia sp. 1_MG-2023]RBW45984.1 hypothetical protein DS901_02365 [Loktanella sp. D2R18]